MIDHIVTIRGIDVSKHVISISTEQTIENDSNPGRATITLVNPDGYYTGKFVPQADAVSIFFKNFVYTDEWTFRTFEGKLTDAVSNPDVGEIVITAEDDMGHLVDALPCKINLPKKTCKEALEYVLAMHDPPITVNYNVQVNPDIGQYVWDEQNNFQDVLIAVQERTGGLFYFNEYGELHFYDPMHLTSQLGVSNFVSNPCEAKSVMGFVNILEIVGYESVSDEEPDQNIPSSKPMIAYTIDDTDYSPGKIHTLRTYLPYLHNVHNADDLQAICDNVMEFYNSKRDSMTEVRIEGIVPDLQSLIVYDAFLPPSPGEASPTPIYGMVLERRIEYSCSTGLECTVKIRPRESSEGLVADFDMASW